MTTPRYILRSLAYYRRSHLWTLLGVMVSVAVLAGALIIGDSIRYSLRRIVFDRLGRTDYALVSGDRFIHARVAAGLAERLQTPVAPLLMTTGMAIADGGERRVNRVQVVGFDSRFAVLGDTDVFRGGLSRGGVIVNTHLAGRLRLGVGDEFLLRIHSPGVVPKEMAWSPDSGPGAAGRFTVKAIAPDTEFGGFNLKVNQVAPLTVFVPLDALGRMMGLEGKSNVFLVAERPDSPLSADILRRAFREIWTLADAGFTLTPLPDSQQVELKSERVFLDSPVLAAVQKEYPDAQRVFSYLVNEIRHNGSATPYSFVSASDSLSLAEDEIVINEWLARDLGAKPGDPVTLTYYVPGSFRSLIEQSAEFRVKAVVPIRGTYADRNLMPDFPGVGDAENCRNWEFGDSIDLDRIRDRDEKYWDDYRGTPKAFLSLDAARKLWQNRYGELTVVRFPGGNREGIGQTLTALVDPAALGFFFRDVRREGLDAGAESIGFDQLFLGLSFFIITAALLLTGLLFAFSVEQRSGEYGLLLAVGFTKKRVRRLILAEGMTLAIAGSLMGVLCGILYHQGILLALKSVWRDIVGTSSLHLHVSAPTVLTALSLGTAVNFLTIVLVAGNRLRQTVADLQKGVSRLETVSGQKHGLSLAAGVICLLSALVIVGLSLAGATERMVATFFAAGSLLLIGGIALAQYALAVYPSKAGNASPGLGSIGVRGAGRRRFRSLAITGLLAAGVFVVFTVGANRRGSVQNPESRASGTGGFALAGESAIPILHDLNSVRGRGFHSLRDLDTDRVRFVSFRVGEGDDASCLNLNRISTPRLLGVEPSELSARGSFTFVNMTGEVNPESPWDVLDEPLPGDVVPGIADQTVITWGLGKAIGDTLTYRDEAGRAFTIKLVGGLANSVFQGNVIISEKTFIRKYPSISGSRFFLVDAPFSGIDETSRKIGWALQDYGLDLIPTSDSLAAFSRVENTYLSIFLILGAFGVMLGSIGVGVVIGRNVSERRGELALLQAVGFSKKDIRELLVAEHSVPLAAGLMIGAVSALVATFPALAAPGSNAPVVTMIFLLILMMGSGVLWVYAATVLATRGELLPALRNE